MPAQDNDAVMLRELSYALGDLQYKYRYSTPLQRAEMRPQLETFLRRYTEYRSMLLGGPVISSGQDIDEMQSIRDEINAAAANQALLTALGRLVGFISGQIV